MGQGFISPEDFLCGASAMSSESNSGISLWEFPTLRIWSDSALAPLLPALQALCSSPAQGDSGASLIGHGGMCRAEGASLEAELCRAGLCSGSAKLMVQEPLATLAGTENPIRLWAALMDGGACTNKCAASPLASQAVGRGAHRELVFTDFAVLVYLHSVLC